jgi:uncharacterized RmlC-like cupin family protein
MSTSAHGATPDWRTEGVRVIPGDALDSNTPQTPGMNRAAAVTHDRAGSEKLWAGTATIHPGAQTGAHHHGELESVIYVVRGRARMRWGSNLEFTAETGPGGFIFVPPFVPQQFPLIIGHGDARGHQRDLGRASGHWGPGGGRASCDVGAGAHHLHPVLRALTVSPGRCPRTTAPPPTTLTPPLAARLAAR